MWSASILSLPEFRLILEKCMVHCSRGFSTLNKLFFYLSCDRGHGKLFYEHSSNFLDSIYKLKSWYFMSTWWYMLIIWKVRFQIAWIVKFIVKLLNGWKYTIIHFKLRTATLFKRALVQFKLTCGQETSGKVSVVFMSFKFWLLKNRDGFSTNFGNNSEISP